MQLVFTDRSVVADRSIFFDDGSWLAKTMASESDHLVASRQGIYLVDHDGYRKLIDGHFFGVTVRDGFVYCFRTVSLAEAEDNPNQGRLLRYPYRDGELGTPEILVEGLDYNGHQVAFFDGSFWLVDTGNQQILEFDAGWNRTAHRIGPAVARRGPDDAHINSFHGRGDRIFLMFHNGHRKMPSSAARRCRRRAVTMSCRSRTGRCCIANR